MSAYDQLAAELERIASPPCRNRQFWLGLAGAPGSGKSTLAAELKSRLENSLLVIPLDGYHLYRRQLDAMDNPAQAHARRGAPFTFDAHRFVADLIEARRSGEGSFPSFDHGIADPVANDIKLTRAHSIVLVEGNYLLLDKPPWNRLKQEVFDETWFLDVPVAICMRRVVERHMKLGMIEEQALRRVTTNDSSNAELVARESPGHADRLIRVA